MKKKVKILLAVLSAMVMLVGSVITVFAVSNSPNTHDTQCLNTMTSYNATLGRKSYPYKTYTRAYYESDGKYFTRLYYSTLPLRVSYRSARYDTYVGVPVGCEYYYIDYKESTGDCTVSDIVTASADGFSMGMTLSVICGNYDMSYYKDGDLTDAVYVAQSDFFPNPPIAELAVGIPTVVTNQIKVILTIAVACLALLVTLSVLRKKLPTFLNS